MARKVSLLLREEVKEEDCQAVREIVTSTGFFYEDEIDIAVELEEERLEKGLDSGYYFLFAEDKNKVVGYTCFGPVPCTKFSYDLYWIAVHNDYRCKGIGKKLLYDSEEKIKKIGGKRIYIETSNRQQYECTRAFYLNCNYKVDAILKDFYDDNDDKVIYVKAL